MGSREETGTYHDGRGEEEGHFPESAGAQDFSKWWQFKTQTRICHSKRVVAEEIRPAFIPSS